MYHTKKMLGTSRCEIFLRELQVLLTDNHDTHLYLEYLKNNMPVLEPDIMTTVIEMCLVLVLERPSCQPLSKDKYMLSCPVVLNRSVENNLYHCCYDEKSI